MLRIAPQDEVWGKRFARISLVLRSPQSGRLEGRLQRQEDAMLSKSTEASYRS
jgi:hypothetical protein